LFFFQLYLTGCSSYAIKPLVDPLSQSLERQTDLQLICEGAPSLLLILDGLINSHPQDVKLLIAGTRAYTAYATALSECNSNPERASQLSEKAKSYGQALLSRFPGMTESFTGRPEQLTQVLTDCREKDVAALFWGAYGWATWIRFQNGAPLALAELPRVAGIMERIVQLDETYYHGAAHIFLGYYKGSKPAAYGGNPEASRIHFERALELGNRQFLAAQLTYAEIYARMTFDRELFEKMLNEVLEFPIDDRPDLALGNQVARRRALRLLDKIDKYF